MLQRRTQRRLPTLALPLTLLALALLALPSSAAAEAPLDAVRPLSPSQADGWHSVAPGVLQRDQGHGVVETYVFGAEGLAWEKARVEDEIARLMALYSDTGDPDVAAAIHDQQSLIEQMKLDLVQAPSVAGLQTVTAKTSCVLSIDRDAAATVGEDGPEASASASFSDTCPTYGCTYAYAIAQGKLGGSYRQYLESDGEYCGYGSAQAAAASAAVVADNDCYSYGKGQVRVQDSLGNWAYFISEATNYQCLTADITGPTTVYVPYGTCVWASWGVDTNHPVSTYQWTWNSSVVGAASTYGRSFCSHATYTYSANYNLGVTVWDSYGNSANDSQVVRVTYRGYCDTVVAQQNEAEANSYSVGSKLAQPVCNKLPLPTEPAQ